MRPRHLPIPPGSAFNKLTVESRLDLGAGKAFYRCRCECGATVNVMGAKLRSGHTKSCGCHKIQVLAALHTTHGHTARRTGEGVSGEYGSWSRAKQRCYNPKDIGYALYGGRGITMCDRWRHSFANFLADMGRKPSRAHSLDRVNGDGNYEPENCRWATPSEQALNRRPYKRVGRRGNPH